MRALLAPALLLLFAAALAACGDAASPAGGADTGSGSPDAATQAPDAGTPATPDAGPAVTCSDARQLACGDRCVDPQLDSLHCGDCTNACASGTACFASTCTTAQAMSIARIGQAAVLGPDERIYVFGGADRRGRLSTSAEAFDPRTNTWSPLPPMPAGKVLFAAGLGADGRIYAAGGIGPSGAPENSVFAFDVSSQTWTHTASLAEARAGMPGVNGPDHRLYAIGGATLSQYVTAVEVLSADGSWAAAASMPTPRYNLGAAMDASGRIYAIGGNDPTKRDAAGITTVEVYDPVANSWSGAPGMLTGRFEPACASDLHGLIYATGGHAPEGDTLSSAEVFDPAANQWSVLPEMRHRRAGHAAVLGPDGRIYAIGGHAFDVADVQATMDVYDPATATWSP